MKLHKRMFIMKIAKFALLLILLPVLASAIADPGNVDTLRIESVSALPGRTCTVPIHFYNDETLYGLEVVMDYHPEYLSLDSFSLVGGRIENYESPFNLTFIDSANLMDFSFVPNFITSNDSIPPGSGLLGTLHFTIQPIAGGITTAIESGSWPMDIGGNRSTIFITEGTQPITPHFDPGEILIQEAPPSADSIWVEKVTGIPGQSVVVNVFGYNQEDIKAAYLALHYSSTNLLYNATLFSGTRGDIAFTKQTSLSDQSLLISLIFDDAAPLTAGTGSLAKIIFDIHAAATEEIVTIDSITYLGVQPTQFILTDELGGLTFTPYFTPGQVEIKSPTDIDDIAVELLPTEFALGQNAPNPFNPATRISFDLPQASVVHLNVFNILGQKVRTLVDDFLPAGTHEVIFDGKGEQNQVLASGVYFYRIEAGEFRKSLKMTLMK